jgi:hypothetical protein
VTLSARPWRDILAAIGARPELEPIGPTLAAAWVANLATPAILVVPVRRASILPNVAWEMVLQVVVTLAGDDDDLLHDLLDIALPALPAGVRVGETLYGQDERAGGTYIVSTTTLTHAT